MRPYEHLSPTSPVKPAGVRVEPPPSLDVAKGTMPAAIAAAEPPEDPPGVHSGFQGLRVTPSAGLAVYANVPNSGAAVLPRGIAPAARSRSTCKASRATGGRPRYQRDPCVVGMPAQSS